MGVFARMRAADEERLLRLQDRLSKEDWIAAATAARLTPAATDDTPILETILMMPIYAVLGVLWALWVVVCVSWPFVIFLAALRILGWF